MTPQDPANPEPMQVINYELLWIDARHDGAVPSVDALRQTLLAVPSVLTQETQLEFLASDSHRRVLVSVSRRDNRPVSSDDLKLLKQQLTVAYDVVVSESTETNAIRFWLEASKDHEEDFLHIESDLLRKLEAQLNVDEKVASIGAQIRFIYNPPPLQTTDEVVLPKHVMRISTWNGEVPDWNIVSYIRNYIVTNVRSLSVNGIFEAMLPESVGGGSGGSTTGTPTGGAINLIDPAHAKVDWQQMEVNGIVRKTFEQYAAMPGQEVDVYIIDTVPYATEADVLAKLGLFGSSQNPRVKAFIQDMFTGPDPLRPNPRIKVHPTPVPNTSGISATMDPDAKWHGLFIAGIILALTKNTTVHLVRAADPQSGYSSFQDIADWLVTEARNSHPGNANPVAANKPVLVNLSLTTNPAAYRFTPTDKNALATALGLNPADPIAMHELEILISESQDKNSELYDWLIGWNFEQQLATTPSHVTMSDLISHYNANQNRCIVAAAANMLIGDGATRKHHAGYPARLKDVISVAALGTEDDPADYSHIGKLSSKKIENKIANYQPIATAAGRQNIYKLLAEFLDREREGFDDDVQGTGILRDNAFFVFGGLIDAFYNNPINSLYLDDIGLSANASGLAGWSGTSFATAVMTGILARLCEIDGGAPNPIGAIDRALALLHVNIVPESNSVNAGYYINMEQI